MEGIRWGKEKQFGKRQGTISALAWANAQQRTPKDRSKAAVSNSGKPMMPE
jgi:hypothetical protein